MKRLLPLLLLAACSGQPQGLPPRSVETPLARVSETRVVTFRAEAGGREALADCEITGPGYRVEATTPAAVELPVGASGAVDATSFRCTRASGSIGGAGIPGAGTRTVLLRYSGASGEAVFLDERGRALR